MFPVEAFADLIGHRVPCLEQVLRSKRDRIFWYTIDGRESYIDDIMARSWSLSFSGNLLVD
jgi:hypothetical protein